MESKHPVTDITLTIQSGGMIAFEKTGIYPEFLLFHSAQLRRIWRFKQVNKIQNGVLKVDGVRIAVGGLVRYNDSGIIACFTWLD